MRHRLVIYGFLALLIGAVFVVQDVLLGHREEPAPKPRAAAKAPITEDPIDLQLRPDARLLQALGEIERIVCGRDFEAAEANWKDGAWQISQRGRGLGTLPRFPDYPEMTALLRGYSLRLGARDSITATPPAGAVARIGRRLVALDPVMAANGADSCWAAGGRSPALLALGARALVLLELETTDRVGIADRVGARAWAAVAVTQALDSTALARESCLLAHRLGYGAHAWEAASALPASDPIRLFARQEDSRLGALAARHGASKEARYLHLVRLSRTSDPDRWLEGLARYFPDEEDLTLPLVGTGLSLGKMATQMPTATVMAMEVIRQLRLVDVMAIPDAATQDVHAMGALVSTFEQVLENMSPLADGTFLDRDLLRAYYRSCLYSALWMIGEHYRVSRSSTPETQEFATQLDSVRSGPGAEFARWYRHLAVAKAGHPPLGELRKDLDELVSFGWPLLSATFRELRDHQERYSNAARGTARAMARRLDTRPAHRIELADIAEDDLLLLPLMEDLYESAAHATSPADPNARGRWAQLNDDKATILRLLARPDLTAPQENVLVSSLAGVPSADSASICAAYQRAIKRHPESWTLVSGFAGYASGTLRAHRLSRAAIEGWLARNGHLNSIDVVIATASLARSWQREGKWARSLEIVSPVASSQQYGAMAAAAEALDRVGRGAEAETLAVFALQRYPGNANAQCLVADLFWRHGKYQEAARLLADPRFRLSSQEWNWTLGPRFAEAFRGRTEEALKAVDALVATDASDWRAMGMLTFACDRDRQSDLAFEITRRVSSPGPEAIVQTYNGWQFLRHAKGEVDAEAWLQPKLGLSDHDAVIFTYLAFENRAWPQMWKVEPKVGSTSFDFQWLMRAAALASWTEAGPERTAAVRAHFSETQPASRYHTLGRFLLGLETIETVLAHATDKKSRCEVAYYVGLRLQAEHRYREAAEWYARSIATNQSGDAEYRWSMTQLTHWKTSHFTLARLAEYEKRAAVERLAAIPAAARPRSH